MTTYETVVEKNPTDTRTKKKAASPSFPSWEKFTADQSRVMKSNFRKEGSFYRSIDVHTMLDCGPSPEMRLRESRTEALPDYISTAPSLTIREEFFGGVVYDLNHHTMFYCDRLATTLLFIILDEKSTAKVLDKAEDFGWDKKSASSSLNDLISQGIVKSIVIGEKSESPKVFRNSDLSAPYLQAPFIVELEMTHACYRECKHCAYNASPSADRKHELSTEDWKSVIKKLAQSGVLSIRFTGGDFLYRKDAVELLEYTDSLNVSYHFLSDTIAFNESNLDAVAKLKNLAYIGSSIDGPDAETHDMLRGEGAFDLLKKRVTKIADKGLTISLGTTLHKGNWNLVRETGRVARALGARYFEVGFLCPIGRGADISEMVLEGEEVQKSLALYTEGVRAGDYDPMQLHYYDRADRTDTEKFIDFFGLISRLPYQTEWPFSRLRVKPDGTTYTAGKLKESGLSIGINIMLDDLDVIWRKSPNLLTLRELGVGRRLHSLDIADLPKELHNV